MNLQSALRVAILAAAATFVGLAPAHAVSEASVLAMIKSPKTNDATLAKLTGAWNGAGKMQLGSEYDTSNASCSFTNRWAADKRLVHMVLRCTKLGLGFSANGYLGSSNGRIRGVWSASGQNAVISGRKSGSGVTLTLSPTNGKKHPSRLTLRVSGNRITAKLTKKDGDTGVKYTVFESTLKK